MAVEDSYSDPFSPHSQETQQSGPTVEPRSVSDGSRNSALSLSESEPSYQEPVPRGLPASQSPIDAAPPSFGTPPVSASAPKPTPKPHPPPPSTLPALQTTPTQLPPAKKARHDDSADSDSEEMNHPRTHSQPSLAPARGFGGFRAPSGPSAFSSGFGSYATAGSSFTAKPSAALASQAAGLRRGTAAKSPLDVAVGNHLKSVLSKEADFKQFQEARSRTLTVAEQVEQYRYLQRKLDEHVGRDIPVEVDLAPGTVTKVCPADALGSCS